MSILAVGTVAFDSIDTPFGSAERVLGGSASYLTLAARPFCDDVRLVGVVGHDFPDEYRQVLADGGVDLEGLEVDEDGETFFWHGQYHYDMNERDTLDTQLNVLASFEPDLPASYRDSNIVCLGNLEPGIQRDVLDQVHDPEFVVADTMNYWIENTPESLRTTLSRVDCFVINDAEARELADEPNLVRAAGQIRDMGPEILIIKKGEHGALLFTDESVFSAPAYPLEDIQDPTGAGGAPPPDGLDRRGRPPPRCDLRQRNGLLRGAALRSRSAARPRSRRHRRAGPLVSGTGGHPHARSTRQAVGLAQLVEPSWLGRPGRSSTRSVHAPVPPPVALSQ